MVPDFCWSRREELNAPSAEYDSAALTLSYTGPESPEEYTIFSEGPRPQR